MIEDWSFLWDVEKEVAGEFWKNLEGTFWNARDFSSDFSIKNV